MDRLSQHSFYSQTHIISCTWYVVVRPKTQLVVAPCTVLEPETESIIGVFRQNLTLVGNPNGGLSLQSCHNQSL